MNLKCLSWAELSIDINLKCSNKEMILLDVGGGVNLSLNGSSETGCPCGESLRTVVWNIKIKLTLKILFTADTSS